MNPDSSYLHGKNQIGTYLSMSRALVDRIISQGLPVIRIPGNKSIMARKSAIDAFMDGLAVEEERQDEAVQKLTLRLMRG